MSEIINIEIQADQSGAEEALQQVNNSLKEGKEAAEALSHVLDGDLADAFKSLGELGKTLGVTLDLAFSPAEIIAFVQVIADVTDKLSKLIADTFIYTDEQKALDAQIKSSNLVIAGYATDIKKLDDEFEKMGKTASQKTAIDIAKLKSELKAASEAVFTLTGDLRQAKENAGDRNLINALGNANAIPGLNDMLGVAQQHLKLLLAQMRNLKEAFREQHAAESEVNAEAQKSKAAFEKAQNDKVNTVNTTTTAIIAIDEKGNQQTMAADFAAIKAENDVVIKASNQQLQTWDEGYKGQIEVAKIASETKIQLITQDFEKGKITQQQEIALIAKAKQDELQLEIFYQQKRQALWDNDPKKVQEIQNQINKIKAQGELVAAKAQTDSLRLQQKNLDQFFSRAKSAMDQSISGFLKGTESFAKAWQNMWADMVVSMVQKLADMMLKWIEHHVAMLVIHTTEKEGEVAADASAAAESKGISLADAIAKIHHSAAAAASRVYEAEAPLGPVIAGLLAAGTYTAVLGFGAMASAESGQYYVPNNQLTMLHPQEMVLPAGIANQMRSVIGGGGDGSGGSGVTVVVNHSVSAVDAASFQGHIRRHGNMIANEVTRALKRKGVR
ncbi:MAG TPA: hypothetical protein VE604_16530 [Candidatus Polarisedimenticolia bacterium]|nr:hypothetical protein [Candidatus Polarisedimenticolia bacterium]